MPIPRIDDLNNVPTVPSVAVFRSEHALLRAGSLTDEDGNRFRAAQFNFANSNASRAYVTKHSPAGVQLAHWQIPLEGGVKHDDIVLDYSGSDLLVLGVGHDTVDPERLYSLSEARIPGVFANHSGGLIPGRGGESIPLPAPQEGEPVDYDLIITKFVTALNTKDSPLQVAMSKIVKNNAKIADGEALNDSFATINGSFYKGDGPYQRFKDTVWEQAHKAMRERGVGTEPPPPPEPKDGE